VMLTCAMRRRHGLIVAGVGAEINADQFW
jgi:hypothetical protein